MVQPIFWKIDSTFVSKFLSSTYRGISATSKRSLLEYWAFAQHWRSTVTILLQSSLFTRLVTTSSVSLKFGKIIIKLTRFLKHGVVILSYFIFHWQDDRNEFSLQHLVQGFLCALRHGWHSCKVKVRLKILSENLTSTLWCKRVRFVLFLSVPFCSNSSTEAAEHLSIDISRRYSSDGKNIRRNFNELKHIDFSASASGFVINLKNQFWNHHNK